MLEELKKAILLHEQLLNAALKGGLVGNFDTAKQVVNSWELIKSELNKEKGK